MVKSQSGDRGDEAVDSVDTGPIITLKPWGSELLLRLTHKYAVKVLRMRAGCRLSLQYHRFKHETLQIGSGHAILELHHNGHTDRHTLERPVDVPPGTIHRVVALEDCEIIEISSIELDDVIRLEDDYGRAGTAAP